MITVVNIEGRVVTLSEVVVNNKINVPAFIDRVRTDTTFYKAFRTMHIIGFTALNDIRMVNKDQEIKASLRSKIRQTRTNNCRSMEVLEESTTVIFMTRTKILITTQAKCMQVFFLRRELFAAKTILLRDVIFHLKG